MRGLPRRVYVGSYEFPLATVPRGSEAFVDVPGDPPDASADGITHFRCEPGCPARGIYISNDLSLRELLDTVLHELTHAVNWVSDLVDEDDRLNCLEEDLALKHGTVWSQLWLDNPRLQAWFTRTANQIRREMKDA